ncbi:prepilin peptidase [Youngiibacter multivorans]|uniref:Leader peptidase (Prepilin peptidase)/N-methyltransferase n=1 Tax=Youngiibacter multivorans TaxID=937251 RepID=A0ABS4G7R0_9CLOT|nr:A24 family peptidase [Youngiibacter multivorans]MBP1920574.1 leader peptidase (prepilin peptidase)/N-methyltransferase [Youngiibacter multivorans]
MALLFLIYGLIIGSFLNVLIFRLPLGENIAFPSSRCNECGTRLKPIHLIPIASYMFLKGKCGYCGKRISPQYPIVELVNGILFTLIYLRFGWSLESIIFAIAASLFIVIGILDFRYQDIFNVTIWFGLFIAFIFLAYLQFSNGDVIGNILSGLAGFSLIALVIVVTRGGMGWGDAWLLLIIGMLLGPSLTAFAFFIASIAGGMVGTYLLVSRKMGRRDSVPFGPFLILGFYVALLIGQEAVKAYLSAF